MDFLKKFSEEKVQKLRKIVANFLLENQKINLSAIREEKAIWEKHVFDSLQAVEILAKSNSKKILDIGTGGGFPGLVLAAIFPEKSFFLLDSVKKKIDAVQKIAEKSMIKNVNFLVSRAENIAWDKKFREKFDFVVSRAAAIFPIILELGLPFLKIDGEFLVFRGPNNLESEKKLSEKFGGKLEKIKKYSLPSGENREIWKIRKIKTNSIFPRKFSEIKREFKEK